MHEDTAPEDDDDEDDDDDDYDDDDEEEEDVRLRHGDTSPAVQQRFSRHGNEVQDESPGFWLLAAGAGDGEEGRPV